MMMFGSLIIILLVLLSVLLMGVWVYRDAKQRGLPAGLWTLLVVFIGSPIGLILYLLIGRNDQPTGCKQCGVTPRVPETVPDSAGELMPPVTAPPHKSYKGKGLLIAAIACGVAFFVAAGVMIYMFSTADGFGFRWQAARFHYASHDDYIKNEGQRSSKNTWTVSYNEASQGYTFKQRYLASEQPDTLFVEIEGNGTVQLIVTQQNETTIDEIIGAGSFEYDLAYFEPGEMNLRLVNIDASNFFGKMVLTP